MPVALRAGAGNSLPMMKAVAPIVSIAALLSLGACGKADEPAAKTEQSAKAETTAEAVRTEKTVVFKADSKTGEVGIDLPGGTGASLRLPPDVVEKMGKDSKLDIDGVGLYPGARVTEVAATSRDTGADKSSRATIRFTAPSTPQAVAEWYVAAFNDKGHKATRSGNRVEGTTTEGSSFTLDLAPEGQGTAGTLVVTDTK
jgi:hypothetical protein